MKNEETASMLYDKHQERKKQQQLQLQHQHQQQVLKESAGSSRSLVGLDVKLAPKKGGKYNISPLYLL